MDFFDELPNPLLGESHSVTYTSPERYQPDDLIGRTVRVSYVVDGTRQWYYYGIVKGIKRTFFTDGSFKTDTFYFEGNEAPLFTWNPIEHYSITMLR